MRSRIVPTRLNIPRLPAPGPAWPFRYELRRAISDRSGLAVGAASLVVSLVLALLLAWSETVSEARVVMGWPRQLPIPPAAVGIGLLGALAFGQEFRYPALAPERGGVPRRVRLLAAKLAVSAMAAVLAALLTLGINGGAAVLFFGAEAVPKPGEWTVPGLAWTGLLVGCAWAGVLAAGVFRSTALGLAVVLTVPALATPLVHGLMEHLSGRSTAGFLTRLRVATVVQWPSGNGRMTALIVWLATQPLAAALVAAIAVLLCVYALTALRSRPR